MSRLAACLLATGILSAALPAAAGGHDLEPWRLGSPRESLGDGTPNPYYSPDAQARFESLATQLGLAISSVTGGPARTTGAAGFAIGLEWTSVSVSNHRLGGTPVWPIDDDSAEQELTLPALHVQKGLPYSFELGMRLQELRDSDMVAATLELRAALVEGVPRAPDVSIRLHAARLLGARDLGVAAGGFDLCVSRPFPLFRSLQLVPYVGWDPTLVFANSNAIDFDPSHETRDNPALDDAVFEAFSALHHRLYGGARLAMGPVQAGLEYSQAAAGEDSVDAFTFTGGAAF